LEVGSVEKLARVCHTCGGFGREGGCPKCGLTPRTSTVSKVSTMSIPADVIPIPYQGKLWEKPENSEDSLKFQGFDEDLEKVLRMFLEGVIPRFSMFISSPPKYGKHKFAYSCMQTALAQQFSVAPLMLTSDWQRLYKVSQINPMYKMFGKYQWDKLITMDVVFIAVDHSDDRFDVVRLIKDILDARAGFGRPTFFISDYKLEELVPQWGGDIYSMIYNPDSDRDFNRYPVVSQRF